MSINIHNNNNNNNSPCRRANEFLERPFRSLSYNGQEEAGIGLGPEAADIIPHRCGSTSARAWGFPGCDMPQRSGAAGQGGRGHVCARGLGVSFVHASGHNRARPPGRAASLRMRSRAPAGRQCPPSPPRDSICGAGASRLRGPKRQPPRLPCPARLAVGRPHRPARGNEEPSSPPVTYWSLWHRVNPPPCAPAPRIRGCVAGARRCGQGT